MTQARHRLDGAVGVIELYNPPHQFMTTRMVRELDTLTEAWASDPAVRAIVITGATPGLFITHFSVDELEKSSPMSPDAHVPRSALLALGALLRGMERGHRLLENVPPVRKTFEATVRKTPVRVFPLLKEIHRVFSRLERMDKPVIAAIGGNAMGGGCELALACDYRLMARGDHVIGLVEVLGGIIPGAGGTQRLAATVGQARAVEMLLDGTVLSPKSAERIGLITRAVDADKLMDEAMKLARRVATRPSVAVGSAKRAVRIGTRLPADDGLAYEMLAFVLSGLSSDARQRGAEYIAKFRAGASAREILDGWREGKGT